MKTGEVHPKRAMFLRTHVGTAENAKGKYELSTGMASCPMIVSPVTGKTWTINWEELIALAVEAGVDAAD